MRTVVLLCTLVLLAVPAAASTTRITYYLDCARVESVVTAVKGRVDISLPRGMEADTLRLKPLQGATISRVDFSTPLPDRKVAQEMARLRERKETLTDRLKALDVKEEIFKAAAKSQSGKAPRATKSNREPLQNIRRGTEFALVQLEDVYRARRKAENELKSVEGRLSSLGDAGNSGGRTVRVTLAGKDGRVAVSYIHPGLKWTPSYDFRLNAYNEVEVVMRALLSGSGKGEGAAVVPALLSDATAQQPISIVPDGMAQIAVFTFPLEKETYSPSPISSLSFSFRNRSVMSLPPGEATCYWQGEYVGKIRFCGCLPGEAKLLEAGKRALPDK